MKYKYKLPEIKSLIGLACLVFVAMAAAIIINNSADQQTSSTLTFAHKQKPQVLGTSITAPQIGFKYLGQQNGKYNYEIEYSLNSPASLTVGHNNIANNLTGVGKIQTGYILSPSIRYLAALWTGNNGSGTQVQYVYFVTPSTAVASDGTPDYNPIADTNGSGTGDPTASITANGQHNITISSGQGFVLDWHATNTDDTTESYVTVDGVKIDDSTRFNYPTAYWMITPADKWYLDPPSINSNNQNGYKIVLLSGLYPEKYDFGYAYDGTPFTPDCNEAAYSGPKPPCYKTGNYIEHQVDIKTGKPNNLSETHTYVFNYIVKQTDTGKTAQDSVTVHIKVNGDTLHYASLNKDNVYKAGAPAGANTIIYPGDHAIADLQGSASASNYNINGTGKFSGCIFPSSVGVENAPSGMQATATFSQKKVTNSLSPDGQQDCSFTVHLDMQLSAGIKPGYYILYTWITNAIGEKYYTPQEIFVYDKNISINNQPYNGMNWPK